MRCKGPDFRIPGGKIANNKQHNSTHVETTSTYPLSFQSLWYNRRNIFLLRRTTTNNFNFWNVYPPFVRSKTNSHWSMVFLSRDVPALSRLASWALVPASWALLLNSGALLLNSGVPLLGSGVPLLGSGGPRLGSGVTLRPMVLLHFLHFDCDAMSPLGNCYFKAAANRIVNLEERERDANREAKN